MAKGILAALQHMDERSTSGGPLTWSRVESIARSLEPKTNLVVPKTVLADAPPYQRSPLGRLRGALRQFRCNRALENLHIKEFEGHWVVHVDRYNPHRHVMRHLAIDHGFRTFLHVAQLLIPPTWAEALDAGPAAAPAAV
jgi:hypothetical protein